MSFGVSLGFNLKTIEWHNKECSNENLHWQLLKFFIETIDEMRTLPYRFIYKALRKCKQISLAEELVKCLNQDQDLMSIGLDGKIGIIISNCFLQIFKTRKKIILLIFSTIIIYPQKIKQYIASFFKTRNKKNQQKHELKLTVRFQRI